MQLPNCDDVDNVEIVMSLNESSIMSFSSENGKSMLQLFAKTGCDLAI